MPKPKLTPEQIAALRAEAERVFLSDETFCSRKARELGVSRSNVWQIIRGRRRGPRKEGFNPQPIDRESYAARIMAKLSAA